MKQIKKHFTLIISTLSLLTGCASMPTAQDMASADFGREIPQHECEALVKSHANAFLKDAASAQYQFGTCSRRGFGSAPLFGISKQYGYYMPVRINAKNGFGGYTGYESYGFLMKNGRIIRKMRMASDYGVMMPM